ncbi:MAG: hypothetical protein OXH75_25875 [Acidobacteria bacterium]|nr:hypothetical protein [Acidobacteriota bacterium]
MATAQGLTRSVVLAGLLGAVACAGSEAPGGGSEPGEPPASREAEAASARPIAGCLDVDGPAVPPPEAVEATPAEQQRYEQLRVETLRLMIDAARHSLPIGPCQTRIDRAVWAASQGDVPGASDIVADVAAGLREAVADAQP